MSVILILYDQEFFRPHSPWLPPALILGLCKKCCQFQVIKAAAIGELNFGSTVFT